MRPIPCLPSRLVPLRGLLAVALAAALNAATASAAEAGCRTSGPPGGGYAATVCVDSPADGAAITGGATVTASEWATGADPGVRRAIFYLDGQYLLTDFEAPYSFEIPSARYANGPHRIDAELLMRDGFTSERAGTDVTFANGPSAPTVNTKRFTPSQGTAPGPGRPFVMAAVGDGASGESSAMAVKSRIVSWQPNLFLYLGDVYEKGTITEFHNWGEQYFGGLRHITNPTIGNHEYEDGAAPGYFDYWDNVPPYYAYSAAGWRFIAINSSSDFGQHTVGTPQYEFLRDQLRTYGAGCVAVYWHHAVYNIGPEGQTPRMAQLWPLLVQNGADVLLVAHDHDYQRWTPMDANGNPSPGGLPQLLVGTGGHGFQSFVRSDPRVMATAMEPGAARFELNQQGMAYRFETVAGTTLDSGSLQCRGTGADAAAPQTPGAVTATAQHLTQAVDLSWAPSNDNVGVTGYDVYRDGTLLAHIGPQTSYTDSTVAPGVSYGYTVRARDAAGNVSAPSAGGTAHTDELAVLFYSGFETGDLTQWSLSSGLAAQQQEVFSGAWAARATSLEGATRANYAYRNFAATTEIHAQTRFKFLSQGASSVNLFAFKTGSGGKLATVFRTSTGRIGLRDEVTTVATTSSRTASTGAWHTLQLRLRVDGPSSSTDVWLDGMRIDQLSTTADYGTAPIGRVEIGDSATTRIYDLALDEAAIDPNRIADTSDPDMPERLNAVAISGIQVDLDWDAGSDDVGLAGYDIYRNGTLLTTTGITTTYSDRSVSPNQSYFYEVRARDTGDNVSLPTDIVTVATPAVFDDDFELGTLARWTTVAGLRADQAEHYSGAWSARATGAGTQASATYSLPAAQSRIFTRVRFKRLAQGTATGNLLRFRRPDNAGIASLTVSGAGRLGVRNDVTGASRTSTADVGDGRWHELQLGVDGSAGEVTVLLDGSLVASLTGPESYGGAQIGRLELGESASGRTFDFAFDDVRVNTDPVADADPPSAPTGLTATAPSGNRVLLDWQPATDNIGVIGYTIMRNGSFLAEVGPVTSFVDDTVSGETTYTYTVSAEDGGDNESPASESATVTTPGEDTAPPTAPELTARVYSPAHVDLSWTASTDDLGVTGYELLRDGELLATQASSRTYRDTSVVPGGSYRYTVRALDEAGNRSPAGTARAHVTLFDDDFETGALVPHWTNVTGLAVGQGQVEHGAWAARATSTGNPTWAYGPLARTTRDVVATVDFKVLSASSPVYLIKLRTAANGSILGIFRNNDAAGTLRLRNDVTATTVSSTAPVSLGSWHRLQLRARVDATATAGETEVWLDGARVGALSRGDTLGSTPVGKLQLGDNSSGRSYDVAFDDVVVDEPPRIVVRNQADPAGTGQTFDFSGDEPLGAFALGHGEQRAAIVDPGTYTVGEGPDPSGWRLAGLDCDDPDDATTTDGRTATIRIELGETVTCTYRNEQLGRVVVGVETDPADVAEPRQQFAFDGDAPIGAFSLTDGQTHATTVAAGDYDLVQAAPDGYIVTGASCDDGASARPSSTSAANRAATVAVEPGETVTCVFTDSRPGELRISERATPDLGATFGFDSADLPELAGTALADGQQRTVSVAPGIYRVDSQDRVGWRLKAVACDDGDSNGDAAAAAATFRIQAGERVTCTFEHEQLPGQVVLEQRTVPADAAVPKDQFAFTADAPIGAFSLGDRETRTTSVAPGDVTVTRAARAGYELTGVSCDDSSSARPSTTSVAGRSATVKVEAGETVRCVFTDTKPGELRVREVTTPALGTAFTFSAPALPALDGASLQNGQERALTVSPGAYSVAVGSVFGWGLDGIACDDGGQADPLDRSLPSLATSSVMFRVQPGERVVCTFSHRERARVTIRQETSPTTLTDTFRYFSSDLPALEGAVLGSGQTRSVSVPPGTYVVGQYPTGKLTGMSCSDASQLNAADRSTVKSSSRTATLKVQEGELLTCTWTNKHQ